MSLAPQEAPQGTDFFGVLQHARYFSLQHPNQILIVTSGNKHDTIKYTIWFLL
jgi:hypothetical protein